MKRRRKNTNDWEVPPKKLPDWHDPEWPTEPSAVGCGIVGIVLCIISALVLAFGGLQVVV